MIRSARIVDVPGIHSLITHFAEHGLMLFRSPTELYENVRSFYVYQHEDRIIGCCALEILWKDMAEVRSLAVDPAFQGKGIGADLVRTAMTEAHHLGIPKVLSLTYRQSFFERLDFVRVGKKALPHKVWTECIRCPKQACCDEIPMLYEFPAEKAELAPDAAAVSVEPPEGTAA